jgi:hypothetical protein
MNNNKYSESKMNQRFNIITILLLIIFTGLVFSAGIKVLKHPSPNESIESKWQWALQQSEKLDNGMWIGYSVNRLMSKNSIIGIHICGSDREDSPTLEQIIYNRNIKHNDNESLSEAAKKALASWDEEETNSEKIIQKEIALLFYYKSNPHNKNEPGDFKISNINLYADLKNKPVIWLGKTSQDESSIFLINMYPEMHNKEVKEDFMVALGIHQQSEIPIDFFTSTIKSKEDNDIREEAVFWLGEHDNEASVDFLFETANTDRSFDVRKKAVFALYLMDSEKAETALIELAKDSKNRNIKKKAIFWLGQKAAKKATEVLEEIVHNDHETEIKEQAVFALSQLDHNEGIPALIDIAQNHTNREVRKKAILWLGESGDERALEAIIDLIQNN